MSTQTVNSVYEQVFDNMRKAAESGLKMQQDMLQQWGTQWPGVPAAPQAMWMEKMREFQRQWANTISDLARRHRETMDRQYQVALESLEEALRIGEAGNPEEYRQRMEHFCRRALECVREVSEVQLKEFQDAMTRWNDLVTKSAT